MERKNWLLYKKISKSNEPDEARILERVVPEKHISTKPQARLSLIARYTTLGALSIGVLVYCACAVADTSSSYKAQNNSQPNVERQLEQGLSAAQFNFELTSILRETIQDGKGKDVSHTLSDGTTSQGRLILFKTKYGQGQILIERGARIALVNDTFKYDPTALYLEIVDYRGRTRVASWDGQEPVQLTQDTISPTLKKHLIPPEGRKNILDTLHEYLEKTIDFDHKNDPTPASSGPAALT